MILVGSAEEHSTPAELVAQPDQSAQHIERAVEVVAVGRIAADRPARDS